LSPSPDDPTPAAGPHPADRPADSPAAPPATHASRGRALAYGALAGALASALRAPPGLSWTELPAVAGTTSGILGAAALLAAALWLDGRRKAFRGGLAMGWMLAGAVAGLALHGLWILQRFEPESRLGLARLLFAGTLLLRVVASGARVGRADAPAGGGQRAEPDDPWVRRAGFALAAAGAVASLEALALHVRAVGVGLPEDATVAALAFLALVLVGRVAFGGLLARRGRGDQVLAGGLALAAAATWVGLDFLGSLGRDDLFGYLRRAGISFVDVGSWRPTALLAAGCLVAPAMVLGAALSGLERPGRLASVLVGAALGRLLAPHVIEALGEATRFPDLASFGWAGRPLAVTTGVAAAGGALALATGRGGLRRRIPGCAALALAAALPFALPAPVTWFLSPWSRVPVEPAYVRPTALGIVAVETERRGDRVVTVDRRRVSPTSDEAELDRLCFLQSWRLLPPEVRAGEGPRVLFVGQLTPARARLLADLGPLRLERTAPWFDVLAPVEELVFEGERPPGARIAPHRARARIAAGEYDLVLVPPVHGPLVHPLSIYVTPYGIPPAPVLGGLEVPRGTIGVVWIDAGAPLAHRGLPPWLLLADDAFLRLTVGAVFADELGEHADRPVLFPSGEPAARSTAIELLRRRGSDRADAERLRLVERLARASAGTPMGDLLHGLALHLRAQKPSSPWESLAQRIELTEDELRAYASTRAGARDDPFLRAHWEGVAWILTEKRRPDLVLAYLEPLSEGAPWERIDRAVARAYLEFDEPASALLHLERALEAQPLDLGLMAEVAACAVDAGRLDRATEALRAGLAIQPGRPDFERALGLALDRAGDPEGRRRLEAYLEAHPHDDEIRAFLAPVGPEPPEPPALWPSGGGDGHGPP